MFRLQKTKNGLAFYCAGSGSPLVVIAGGPGISSRVYRELLSPLAERHTCYFWDCRGTGQSDVSGPPSFKQDFDDFSAIIETALQKSGSYSLLAHSYGGLLALRHAISQPNSLDRMILAGTAAGFAAVASSSVQRKVQRLGPELMQEQGQLVQAAQNGRLDEATLSRFLTIECQFQLYRPSERLLTSFMAELEFNLGIAMMNTDWLPIDYTADLKKIRARTLVLRSDYDAVVPSVFSQSLIDFIPGAVDIRFENCGHWPFAEQPNAFFAALR